MLSIAKNFVYRPINPYFRQGSANLSLGIASSDPPNRGTSFFFFYRKANAGPLAWPSEIKRLYVFSSVHCDGTFDDVRRGIVVSCHERHCPPGVLPVLSFPFSHLRGRSFCTRH